MKRCLLFGLFFLLASGQIFSLTIEDAVAVALRNNIGLELERLELERRLRSSESAWNRFQPSVSASSSFSRDLYSESDDPWRAQFALSSNLSLSVETVRRGRLTALQYASGELSYDLAHAALVRDVSIAFFSLLLEAERIRLRRDSVEAARERLELAQAEFESGRISRYELLSQRVAYENQRPELAQLEDAYYLARRDFTLLLGMDPHEPVVPVGTISAPGAMPVEQEFLRAQLAQRPDLQRARLQVQERRFGRSLSANEFLPTLSLSTTLSRSNPMPFSEPWFGGEEDRWLKTGSFGIGLSVPLGTLFPDSQRRVALEEAERRVVEAELQYERAVLRAENEMEAALRRLRRAETMLELLELNTELALEAYRLAESSYELGQIDALELRSARLELERAQLAALEERYRGRVAVIELEFAVGTELR